MGPDMRGAGPSADLLAPGPHLDPSTGGATFVVATSPGVRPVRVCFHLRDFGADPVFVRRQDRWVAHLPPPPVDRLEYLLVVRDRSGAEAMVRDPANPRTAPGVFGEHSLLEWPGYRPPSWLGRAAGGWSTRPVELDTGAVRLVGLLHTPEAATDDELPLLVAHDGPEYARLAGLLDHLAVLAADRPELRSRVLLLAPVDRDADYSANPAYATALVERLLPQLASGAPVVGVGASLGALALLHASATFPGAFGGLFLQSGSFFLPRFDAHEQRFAYYPRVVDFVAGLDADALRRSGLRVAITAGLGEENLDNNRALARRLQAAGVPVTLAEGRDGHNFTAWRDLLAPSLGDLLARLWPAADPSQAPAGRALTG